MTGLEHPWSLVYVAGPGTNPPCIRGTTVQILLFWLRIIHVTLLPGDD